MFLFNKILAGGGAMPAIFLCRNQCAGFERAYDAIDASAGTDSRW